MRQDIVRTYSVCIKALLLCSFSLHAHAQGLLVAVQQFRGDETRVAQELTNKLAKHKLIKITPNISEIYGPFSYLVDVRTRIVEVGGTCYCQNGDRRNSFPSTAVAFYYVFMKRSSPSASFAVADSIIGSCDSSDGNCFANSYNSAAIFFDQETQGGREVIEFIGRLKALEKQ